MHTKRHEANDTLSFSISIIQHWLGNVEKEPHTNQQKESMNLKRNNIIVLMGENILQLRENILQLIMIDIVG